jgi:aminotransferase
VPAIVSQRHLSQIAPLIVQSEIRFMSVECERVGGMNLAQGICDTDLPPWVAAAAKEAIDAGLNTYTRADGTDALRQAIAARLTSYNRIQADPN